MAKASNQVNGLTKLLLVALRVVIGWHLCYEGYSKYKSLSTERPFSAEGYLRNAWGPLRQEFRNMIPDIHGTGRFDEAEQVAQWRSKLDAAADYYGLSAEQKKTVSDGLDGIVDEYKDHLQNPANAKKIASYKAQLDEWQANDRKKLPDFDQQRHRDRWRDIEGQRRELTGPIDAFGKRLDSAIDGVLSDEQRVRPRPQTPINKLSQLEQANLVTTFGLLGCGICMMLGLFSRLACLGGAILVTLFYLPAIPYPGSPPAPEPGSYLFVNKNLIEALACLMLATTPSGIWGGLDALIRGLITRPMFGAGKQEAIEWQEQAKEY